MIGHVTGTAYLDGNLLQHAKLTANNGCTRTMCTLFQSVLQTKYKK